MDVEYVRDLEVKLGAIGNDLDGALGLYHGTAGLCICYFLLSGIAVDRELCLQKARALMDELSDNIHKVDSLSFDDGLAGIGWAVEWLSRNNYIEADTNEILADLDDELYRSVVYSKAGDISLFTGTLGRAMYFYRRLTAEKYPQDRYRRLCNQECLVLLTDEINDYLGNEEKGLLTVVGDDDLAQLSAAQIRGLAQCLLFLTSILSSGINSEVVQSLICRSTGLVSRSRPPADISGDRHWHAAHKYLLYALYKAGVCLKELEWAGRAIEFYPEISAFQDQMLKAPDGSCSNFGRIFDWLSLFASTGSRMSHSWCEGWLL